MRARRPRAGRALLWLGVCAAVAVALAAGGCTSFQEVTQDAGKVREAFWQAAGLLQGNVQWRDQAIVDMHRRRHDEVMDALEALIEAGEFDAAQALFDKELALLEAYDPVGQKLDNVSRILDRLREEESKAGPPAPS